MITDFEHFNSGHWEQRYQYKSFEPAPINHDWTWRDATINELLATANHALGQLDAFSLFVPDVDIFINMHITKEAQTSSKIEGTQTSIDEVLLDEEFVRPERRDDRQEVLNYVAAISFAVERLKTLPLSNRLLKETHKILLHGVRGEYKQPGEFRRSQNWIGGSNLSNAAYIPPHQDNVADLMRDLELFWHNDAINVPHLIRIAISHYQFESIHPFLDGNGRIGRLLVPLYLVDKKLLSRPSLYLSAFFEQNRAAYYDALTRVRMSNDLLHWIRFFLTGIAETASKGRDVFRSVLELRTETENKILALGRRAPNAAGVVAHLYSRPYVTVSDVAQITNASVPTANKLIKDLTSLGILEELTGQAWGRVFAFAKYIRLFTEKN